MLISCPICQWCHAQLGDKGKSSAFSESTSTGFGNTNFFEKSFINKQNFCDNNYCEERYNKERNKIPTFRNKSCAFCYINSDHFSWTIGENSFCNGKCIDLFDEMQVNPELRELKLKEKRLRYDLEEVENSVKTLLERIGPVGRS